MKYKYGIFDLDGTIINTMPTYTKVFSEILNKRFEIPVENSRKYYICSAGTSIEIQFQNMLKNSNISFTNTAKLTDKFFKTVNKEKILLFKKAKDVIKHLYNKNIPLFISTGSRTESTKKKLKEIDLLKYFSVILGSNEIPKGPEHIEEFAKYINLPTEEFAKQTFYCGDGLRDMEIAEMFEIYAIGIAHTVSKKRLIEMGADVAIDKIGDVLELDVLK